MLPGTSEVVETALNLMPPRIADMVRDVDILAGVDPVFAGLHDYRDTDDGRSYSKTAHVAYAYNQKVRPYADRRTTMVLPTADNLRLDVVVHEFGHVLHEKLDWVRTRPVTWYARRNAHESFAESFSAWLLPRNDRYRIAGHLLRKFDKKTMYLFESLSE